MVKLTRTSGATEVQHITAPNKGLSIVAGETSTPLLWTGLLSAPFTVFILHIRRWSYELATLELWSRCLWHALNGITRLR